MFVCIANFNASIIALLKTPSLKASDPFKPCAEVYNTRFNLVKIDCSHCNLRFFRELRVILVMLEVTSVTSGAALLLVPHYSQPCFVFQTKQSETAASGLLYRSWSRVEIANPRGL